MKVLAMLVTGATLLPGAAIADIKPPPDAIPVLAVPAPTQAPPAAEPAPASTIPTPTARAAVSVLQNACLPLLHGAKLNAVASKLKLKNVHGDWLLPVDDQRQVELTPPDAANPALCSETITHRAGGDPAIYAAVDQWARAQTPALQPVKVESPTQAADHLWLISSWSARSPKGDLSIVLTDEKTLSNQPLKGRLGQATLMVSVTPN